MTDNFSQQRKERAGELDDEIFALVADHYNVSESRVHSYEFGSAGDDRHHHTDNERGAQVLDYAGHDIVVDGNHYTAALAKRVRDDRDGKVDFGVKIANGQGRAAEYVKIKNGVKYGTAHPSAYVHAVRDGNELIEFVLVDVEKFVEAEDSGVIKGQGPYQFNHGEKMKYYDIDKMEEEGCILTRWSK